MTAIAVSLNVSTIGTVKLGGCCLGIARMIRYLRWMTTSRDPLYAGYSYPAELIAYAVWLYFRFPLSLRMVEEMLAARGILVTLRLSCEADQQPAVRPKVWPGVR